MREQIPERLNEMMEVYENGSSQPITVKVAILGKTTQTISVDSNSTLKAFIAQLGDYDNADVRLNGVIANGRTILKAGDIIAIVPRIQGG